MSTMANDPRLASEQSGNLLQRWWQSFRQSDLGPLPIIFGLLIIWLVFQRANHMFLSPLNLTNLLAQISALGTIAVGAVLVLLLGEVDLSAGAVSGLCAAIMAVLNVKYGVPGPIAVLAGLLAGLAVGLFQGFWVTRFKIPSFIVTLGRTNWLGGRIVVCVGRDGHREPAR